MVRVPRGLHSPAGAYTPGYLRWGPVVRPIRVVPVQLYRQPVVQIPLVGGQRSAIVSSAPAGGSGALVQSAWNSGTFAGGSGTVTVTLGTSNPSGPSQGPTTAGNCLIAYVATDQGTTNPTVSGITLGGAAGNWASARSQNNNADLNNEIWVDWNCTGGQTAVAVTVAGGSGAGGFVVVRVEERAGILATSTPVDQVNGANGNSAAPASGNTPTLSQANEIVVGAITGGATITGPASPWVNQPDINLSTCFLITGAQVASSTTGIGYAGTMASNVWGAAVVSLKLAPPSASAGAAGLASVSAGPAGLGNVWYPAQVVLSTTTGLNGGIDTSLCNVYLGPPNASNPNLLIGSVFTGNGVLAAALPAMTPGLYLTASWSGGVPGDVASMNIIGTMDSLMPG